MSNALLLSPTPISSQHKAPGLRMSVYMAPSMIAMKYQRQPYVGRPLQPGERYSVARDMETCIRYSAVQYSTVQYSTLQYNTVQ